MTLSVLERDKHLSNSDAARELLSRARSIAPTIRAQADAIEEKKTITQPAYEALAETELFWMMLPNEIGGAGLGIRHAVEVIEEVSRADGSTGWALMANSITTGLAAAHLDDKGIEQLFCTGPRAIMAGQLGPIGYGRHTASGLNVHGRYQFASGSAHATHLAAGVHLRDDKDERRMLESGIPDAKVAFIARDKVELQGNWDVMGLVGTGSYDYEVPDQVVPDHLTIETFSTTPRRGNASFALGLIGVAVAGHTGVALGIMKRALEEVLKAADGKIRMGYSVPIIEYPVFKHEFSCNEALYQAARAYALQVFVDVEDTASAGLPLSAEQHARVRQASTWTHNAMEQVVRFCHLWGGTASFRNPSALGRCARDASVATQHVLIDQIALVDAAGPIIAALQDRR